MPQEEDHLSLAHSAQPLPVETPPVEPRPGSLSTPLEDLEKIFRDHRSRVFGAAYRLTGSAEDAEDVLQTIFLRLLRRRRSDLSPSPAGYLYRAAVNASLDLLRSKERSSSIPLDEGGRALPESPRYETQKRQQDAEVRRALRRALLRLSPKAAKIFTLRFLEGESNREIAGLLEITENDVAVTLHRARQKVCQEIRSFTGGR